MCCDVVEKNEKCECVGMYNYTWSLASTSHLEEKIIGAQKNEFRPPTSTHAQTIKLFLIKNLCAGGSSQILTVGWFRRRKNLTLAFSLCRLNERG